MPKEQMKRTSVEKFGKKKNLANVTPVKRAPGCVSCARDIHSTV